MIDYNGKRFRNPHGDDGVVAEYRQSGDLVWAHFAGGPVRRGMVNGIVDADGVLSLVYTMVLADGDIVTGYTHTTPETGDDGVLRLREEWEHLGPNGSRGTSYLEELR